MTAAERLLNWWQSQHVPVLPGASQEAIDAFEARYQVCLPEELRTFYLAYGGLGSGWLDGNDWRVVFDFSTLDDLRLMDDCNDAALAYTPTTRDPGFYFQIADFFIESHVYAVRVTANATARAPIFALFGRGYQGYQCADSFDAFARMYIEAPDLVTAPPNREIWLARHAGDSIRPSG